MESAFVGMAECVSLQGIDHPHAREEQKDFHSPISYAMKDGEGEKMDIVLMEKDDG